MEEFAVIWDHSNGGGGGVSVLCVFTSRGVRWVIWDSSDREKGRGKNEIS